MKERIVLIGAGPLGVNAAHIVEQQGKFELAGFVDSKGGEIAGYPVLGDDAILDSLIESGITCAVACIGDSRKRTAVSAELKRRGFRIPALAHPLADIGKGARIGEGAILFHGAFIGPNTVVGPYSVIEASAFVGHDVVLDEGVLLAARVTVGNHTQIGCCSKLELGASCASKLRIGKNCVVGAFSTLLASIDDNHIAAGTAA